MTCILTVLGQTSLVLAVTLAFLHVNGARYPMLSLASNFMPLLAICPGWRPRVPSSWCDVCSLSHWGQMTEVPIAANGVSTLGRP